MIAGEYAWVDGQYEDPNFWFFMVVIRAPAETYVEYRSLIFREIEMLCISLDPTRTKWMVTADQCSFTIELNSGEMLKQIVASMPTSGEGSGLFFTKASNMVS